MTDKPTSHAPSLLKRVALHALTAAAWLLLLGAAEGLGAGGGITALIAALGLWGLLWPALWGGRVALGEALRGPESSALLGAPRRLLTLLTLTLVGAALGQGLLGALIVGLMGRLTDAALLPTLAAAGGVGVALGGLLVGALLYGPLWRAHQRWPWLSAPLLLLGLGAAYALLSPPLTLLDKAIGAWRLGLLAALGIGALLPGPRRAAWWAPLIALGLTLASVGGGLYAFSRSPGARLALSDGGGLTPWIAGGLWRLKDEDGDGFSPWFGGGDCDDADPEVNPGAYDRPADGVDQDCEDGDAPAFAHGARGETRHAELPEALTQKRWNLILLTVEATRPANLSLYGYERETTPNLEALAPHALIFERAYTPANATRYALPTMMTGRLLGEIELMRAGHFIRVLEGNNTLFERLQGAGWRTQAVVSTELQRGMFYGLERGFDVFEGVDEAKMRARTDKIMLEATLGAIDQAAATGRPWAIWAHWLEPHEPYLRRDKYNFGKQRIDRYDGEIAATDAAIGLLIEALKIRKLAEDTVLVITSDHGEEFGEHGGKYHGKKLFEESVRVPLLIHVPGTQGHRVRAPVSTMDIPETIANLFGLPPGPDYSAVSHAGWWAGQGREDWRRLIFIDCVRAAEKPNAREVALIEWPYKATLDLQKKHERLFDLTADPGEARNLRDAEPERYARLKGIIKQESTRHQANLTERLKARWISREAPAWAEAPVKITEGFEWLGARLETRREGVRELHTVTNLFKASGPERPDLRIQLTLSGGGLDKDTTQRYRPLAGLYPTHHWAEGEILTDARLVRFVKREGDVRVQLTVYGPKKRLFGPKEIGTLKSWVAPGEAYP